MSSLTETLARTRLTILAGAALLALAAAVILTSQPAEAQTMTGTLVAGQTNRCAIKQAHATANRCTITVPGTGKITVSDPNPAGATSHLNGARILDSSARTVAFAVSYSVPGDANNARVGKSTWTIRNTPTSGNPVDYTFELVVYAHDADTSGTTLGFTSDNTAPANAAPAGVPPPALTGTLEAGKTNRCVLEQGNLQAGLCTVTVPGTGIVTLSAPNPPDAVSNLASAPVIALPARTLAFAVSTIVTGDADIGKSTWTIRNTPTSGQPVDYTFELEVYATGTVPSGTTKGFSTDTTAPTSSAPAAVPAPAQTGTLAPSPAVNRCLLQQAYLPASSCTVTVPGSGTVAVTGPDPSSASTILRNTPSEAAREVSFNVSANTSGAANNARIGKGVWTITDTNSGTVTTYKVAVTVYGLLTSTGAPALGVQLGFFDNTPLGAPTGVTAEAGEGKVTLSWTAPSGTLTKYQYVSKKGSEAFGTTWMDIDGTDGDSTSGTVTGLEAASYQFKVRAVSAGGNGAESTATTAVNVKPSAPTGLRVETGDGEVTLSWTKPSGTLTKHQYQQKEGAGSYGTWTDIAGSASLETHKVTGLKGGVAYRFKLRAVSAGGDGAESDETTAVTLSFAAPTGVTATGGVAQVALSWTAPLGTPTKYAYRWKRGSGEYGDWMDIPNSATATSYTVEGLRSGSYAFQLRAQSGTAGGAASDEKTASVTAAPAPAKPAGVTAVGGAGQATLGWTDPSNANILRYEYRQKPGGGSYGTWTTMTGVGASGTSYVVTGLAKGSYTYQVRAVTEGGGGPASDEAAASVTPVAPVAPTGLKAAAAPGGVGTVTLSWTAPANAALADVAKYQYRSSSGGSWTDIADSPR